MLEEEKLRKLCKVDTIEWEVGMNLDRNKKIQFNRTMIKFDYMAASHYSIKRSLVVEV